LSAVSVGDWGVTSSSLLVAPIESTPGSAGFTGRTWVRGFAVRDGLTVVEDFSAPAERGFGVLAARGFRAVVPCFVG
jgi:hypothetical protein